MADIVVTTAPSVNLTLTTDQTNVVVTQSATPSVTVQSGYSTQNVFVGEDEPAMTAPGLWIQTFDNGDWSLWIEDGK